MKDLVSIIIPVYNASEFIDRCLESVVKQTYKKIEIIIINDGSTDNSRIICEKWTEKDKRIKLINKDNTGVSDTRNLGVKISTGEFVTFIDSDDYIDKTMIELLIKNIKKEQSDISICGIKFVYETKKKNKQKNSRTDVCINKNEFLDELLIERFFIGSLWGKLYRKKIIKDYKLNKKLAIAEDLDYLIRLGENIKKVSILKEALYFYYINNKSVTKRATFNKYKDELYVLEKNKANDSINKELLQKRILRINLDLFYRFKNSDSQNSKICLNTIKSFDYNIGLSNYFNTKQKIKFIIAKLFL